MTLSVLRWHRGWVYLSLDRIHAFRHELWCPLHDDADTSSRIRAAVRATAQETGSQRESLLHLTLASWYWLKHGPSDFSRLETWVREVLVLQGSDRETEGRWSRLAFRLCEPAADVPGWIADGMRQVAARMREFDEGLVARLGDMERAPTSSWDREVMEKEEVRSEDVDAVVRATATYNHFLVSWDAVWRPTELPSLREIHRVAVGLQQRDGGAPQALGFPSTWAYSGARLLRVE